MTEAEIRDRLQAYITTELAPEHDALGVDDSMIDTGLLDSLKMVKLTEFIAAELGVEVSDDDLDPDNFETVSVLAAFVAHKRAE